jgi:hypothetical protein
MREMCVVPADFGGPHATGGPIGAGAIYFHFGPHSEGARREQIVD